MAVACLSDVQSCRTERVLVTPVTRELMIAIRSFLHLFQLTHSFTIQTFNLHTPLLPPLKPIRKNRSSATIIHHHQLTNPIPEGHMPPPLPFHAQAVIASWTWKEVTIHFHMSPGHSRLSNVSDAPPSRPSNPSIPSYPYPFHLCYNSIALSHILTRQTGR